MYWRSLTMKFSVVSLLSIGALAVVLATATDKFMTHQAVASAADTAEAYIEAGVSGGVVSGLFQTSTYSGKQKAALDAFMSASAHSASGGATNGLVAMRMWDANGNQVYDSMGAARQQGPDVGLRELAMTSSAPAASVSTEHMTLTPGPGRDMTVLDVYVAMKPSVNGPVLGAAEMQLDYEPTAHTVADAVWSLTLIIAVGLAVLWLLLFQTVHRASRRLRVTAAENARLALLDPLTGLPNRRLLSDRLLRASRTRGTDGHLALLLLDLDRFKEINDTLGHDQGDALLVQVAERLTERLRDGDTVARLGGDEFAVLLPGITSAAEASTVAERVLRAFDEPFALAGLSLRIEASAGLALMPDHALDELTLLRRADVAMYTAKASQQGLTTYSEDGADWSKARLVLPSELWEAIRADDQLFMHYQCQVDLVTGAVVGLEALLRWNHPQRGQLAPSEFIRVGESAGLMRSLTARVLRLVCAQIASWRAEEWTLPVAINLSALNLTQGDLAADVAEVLAEFAVPASLLQFEITESAVVADPVTAAAVLSELAALGSTVALDDFGTGSTSLSQLRDLPIQVLKIDQSFVRDLDPGSASLLKVMVDLGHEFSLVVVAEGIEDASTEQRVRALGCGVAQGFYYARPVPGSQVAHEVRRLAKAAPVAP